MNGVIGMTDLLMGTSLDEDQRRYAETVRSSAEALLQLINDILDFSKIEAGKMSLEAVDFDLPTLVEDVVGTVVLAAEDKGIRLICRVDSDVPGAVEGDPNRLRQILINLLSNAVKFTLEGEVELIVSVPPNRNDHCGSRISFDIRDTGIGIPSDKIDTLFRKFSQVDASNSRRFGGTGLGLAISQQLVGMMGGEIRVESEVGKGSRFFFEISMETGAEPVGESFRLPDEILGKSVRLWFEDEREILAAAAVVRRLRMNPVVDEGGAAAFAVVDYSGDDGLAGVRSLGETELPVLLVVPVRKIQNREELIRGPVVDFVARPVRLKDFYNSVQHGVLHPGRKVTTSDGDAGSLPESKPKLVAGFDGQRRHVLLVEDGRTNQRVAMALLGRFNLEVDVAENGVEAIEALRKRSYDIVFMDIQMPEMDGLEATARIRGGKSGVLDPKVTIVAMTANAMQGDREDCLRVGMNDYLSKPIHIAELRAKLEEWLPPVCGTGH